MNARIALPLVLSQLLAETEILCEMSHIEAVVAKWQTRVTADATVVGFGSHSENEIKFLHFRAAFRQREPSIFFR